MTVSINVQFPRLATKAEIAKLPTRRYLWGVLAAIVAAYTAALAAVVVLPGWPALGSGFRVDGGGRSAHCLPAVKINIWDAAHECS